MCGVAGSQPRIDGGGEVADDLAAFIDWLNDPESDPALVFVVEERFGVTFE